MLLSTAAEISVAKARWFTCAWQFHQPRLVHVLSNRKSRLTSYVTGPDDGVASPVPFGVNPMLHQSNLNTVARSGARGVRPIGLP